MQTRSRKEFEELKRYIFSPREVQLHENSQISDQETLQTYRSIETGEGEPAKGRDYNSRPDS